MMKHRLLAVLMAAVLMVAAVPYIIVNADDAIGNEAKACKELGILLGDGKTGITTQYLSQNPTRLQAYIIALRLKGLYGEAGNFTSKTNFMDTSEAVWAKNYLAYAKNTPELGWTGYPDGRFGVNDKISGQAFYKVMLETLGYKQNVDFTYPKTFEFAEKIGLVENADAMAKIKSFTINDIAKGIFRALNTTAADTDKRLADVLVDKGIFRREAVEAAGLNSNIQIKVMVDGKSGIAWVPIKDTYKEMGGYISEDSKRGMYYEIKKGTVLMKITEGVTSAFINSTKLTLEKPIIKGEDDKYYIPVSVILATAKDFGYECEYVKTRNILELRELPSIKSTQNELVIAKGDKKSIRVEKTYSGTSGDVTGQCTFKAASNNGIVAVSVNGEVKGATVGSAEIIISYEGKEVDRVVAHVVDIVPKYYPVSYYEQIFDTAFRLDKPNYTDGYGVVWNKMAGIMTSINEADSVDTGSSLNILNYSENGTGITVDLSKLLEERAIQGKKSTLKISARAVSDGAKIYVKANSKSKYKIVSEENTVVLDSQWKNIELLKIDIPEDAQELTLSIGIGKNEEIRLDAFTMTLN